MRLILSFALLAGAAFAQTEQTRTFTFAHTQEHRFMQEMVNLLRGVAEIQRVAAEPSQRTMTVAGNPDQLALATWLFTELDRQASRPAALQVRDNMFSDPRASAVKILSPAHIANAQQAQEAINGIRSIAEVQRCVALSGPGAIVIRGNPEQVALAEWIVGELDRSMSGARPTGARQYNYPDSALQIVERRTTAVRIYYPAAASTPVDIQEMINGIRAIAEAQRVVGFTATGAIIARSSTEQAELMDWLVKELDRGGAAPRDYRWAGATVRVASLPKTADLAATVVKVRQASGMQRVVGLSRQRAIVMRGTPDQLATADPLLRQW